MTRLLAFTVALLMSVPALAGEEPYRLQPGDLLDVSIWGSEDHHRQVLVLPDGTISYPLTGNLEVVGMTVAEAEAELKSRLVAGNYYLEAPPLTVSVADARGHMVFVIGQVLRPGAIPAPRRLTVVQALSLAGGLDKFADPNGIIVIRRNGSAQEALPVDYTAVRSGRDLSSNLVLEPGDVLVVPEAGLFSSF